MSEEAPEGTKDGAKEEVPSPAERPSKRKAADDETLLSIPRNSVKKIMKLDEDVKQVQQEAVIMVAKATELFMAKLAKQAHQHAVSEGRRQVKYDDILAARLEDESMTFLKHIIPELPTSEP
mmetsp:Transcript_1231/g.2638  ORF Transcript_1231/g.2638 Transcript_1231/m.2638 type:complete len:122 (+) Transcript_1231:204-569(+)|eukprot:CAMPEP_0172614104 /NCGR_PEP_ID=MMETSP1068-20121228/49204_1 /TAXON_ID=35684 /ORGANISM="Pseudopedinella elastica, Strain CCMP716" /LENGTH=121 /DNA_ID=CAMNT_0013418799 /DNA_START=189 /DNA_END=554 /DNA_ORIENTATION=+